MLQPLKKNFFLLISFAIFLSGCSSLSSTDEPLNSLDLESKSDQYKVVYQDEIAYLYRDDQKFIDIPLIEWLGGDKKFNPELWWSANIWFQRQVDQQTYLYFRTGRECGGCIWYESKYMVIDEKTLEIFEKELPVGAHDIFELPSVFIFTDDKSKAAIITIDGLESEIFQESIYILDFEAVTLRKYLDIPEGQNTLFKGGHGVLCLISDQSVYWNKSSGELIVNPTENNLVDYKECVQPE